MFYFCCYTEKNRLQFGTQQDLKYNEKKMYTKKTDWLDFIAELTLIRRC